MWFSNADRQRGGQAVKVVFMDGSKTPGFSSVLVLCNFQRSALVCYGATNITGTQACSKI